MKPIDCLEHITSTGERWDTLAWMYYGDPHAYGRIIEANPALDIDATLPSGTLVLVPIIASGAPQALAAQDLPPWKR